MNIFSVIKNFFQPPPPASPLPTSAVSKEYKKYQWQVFWGIFVGYGSAYLVRRNFALAMPYLIKLGYTKLELGLMLTVLVSSYGVSKLLMGAVSDRSNARYFLATGLLVSAITTFVLGVCSWSLSSIYTIFFLMLTNGWAQGMCHPPCSRILTHWFPVAKRGVVVSSWDVAHNLGSGLLGPLAILGMAVFGDWRSIFYLPAIFVLGSVVFVIARLKDTPLSLGLPPVEDYQAGIYKEQGYREKQQAIVTTGELSFKEILFGNVFNNKYIWFLAIANIFVYFVRFGVIDWLPTYLAEVKGYSYRWQGAAYFVYEYAGIPSIFLGSYISDKFFASRREPVVTICMLLIILPLVLYWFSPPKDHFYEFLALTSMGFLIYAPIILINMQVLATVYKKAAGTAAGFTSLFGYLGGTVGAGAFLGVVIERFGWNVGFLILIIAAILAVISLLPLWVGVKRKRLRC